MKKILKFIAPLLLLLSSCGVSNFEKDTTVILDVTTNVTPSFSANFGEGTYQDNVYTHHVNWRKDLYIYLSYEGLATQTVFIPADEMSSSTIRKSVVFGNSLSTVVTITADNIDDISLAKIETNNKLVETKYDVKKKKIVKLTFEGRDTDLDITLKLDGYKDTNIHIDKEKIVGGIYNLNQTFAKENETVLTLLNAYANIYEYPSGKKVKDISSWNGNMVNKILDTDKTYYITYTDKNGNSRVKFIDKKNGLFIEGNNNYSQDQGRLGWLNIYYERDNGAGNKNKEYVSFYIINTIDHEFYTSHDLYEKYLNSHSYAIIFNSWTQDYSGWFIIPDMSALSYEKQGDKYNSEYSYTIPSLENLDRINFIDEIYDLLEPTKKLREENYFYGGGGSNAIPYELRDNSYVVKSYGLDSSKKIRTKIVDEKGEDLFDTSFNFDSLVRYNEELTVKGKSREVNIHFIEDLITFDSENNCYRYPSVMVDTSKNYVKVFSAPRGNYLNFDSVYDSTADEFVNVKDNSAFEGQAGHEYIVYSWEDATTVKLDQASIERGMYIIGSALEYKFSNNSDYELDVRMNGSMNVTFLDEDGITHLLTSKNQGQESTYINIYLKAEDYYISGGYDVKYNDISTDKVYDVTPYISQGVFDSNYIETQESGLFNKMFAYSTLWFANPDKGEGEQGVWSCSFFHKMGHEFTEPIVLNRISTIDGTGTPLEITNEDFKYNEMYQGYTIDPNEYRIIRRGNNFDEWNLLDHFNSYRYSWEWFVVPKDTVITFADKTVNLAETNSLYIRIDCEQIVDSMTYDYEYVNPVVTEYSNIFDLATIQFNY